MLKIAILREFWDFMRGSKKFWLVPIILILLLMGLFLVFTESSVVAPFIYALF